MFHLSLKDIHLAAYADNKESAIRQVAAALAASGYVSERYIEGMLEREIQSSTYLGNGIAIPHGTTATRDQVLHTGVQVLQFPDGVAWGNNQTVHIVIGIAAKSDEHLTLLHQLTRIISDENLASQMAKTASADELYRLLMSTPSSHFLDASTITLDIDAHDLTTLQALNIARLQQAKAVNAAFIADVLARPPIHLGQGLWLSDSAIGNLRNAVAITRPKTPFTIDGQPVGVLMTIAYADDQLQSLLSPISTLLQQSKAERLYSAPDAAAIIALLTTTTPQEATALSADFILPNEHGLHTRPSSLLVNTIKQFNSQITIAHLDGSGVPVDGRKLMQVAGLGVKKGERIRFTAVGSDAEQALTAITTLIEQNMGGEIA
ncbi:fused PTS fructose transporter subunit IIA/HPr protein [Xenorhabdus bovienii]|uniref:Multiphosphoryl transfer protein n=1 Tax=Xenorhabdus bovienii TaxID=40576 RepID=A0A0B6XEP1_XENBV|nr:fused PTS fructose transporter subunit IIA/HPr protein [Xenorhabdus bovienii]CDG89537.1 fused fructose-specific PTS enzymes: IIA component; HPr component [Xenorhabdus bovienii str. feltiae France]CDG92332.1 fused fructose-specific PTS enzymes: IIA component; HPr component [Xenorhabdus bovienii str. feltiae Florida]CDM91636.1 Multiphosphoryl transfer protein [Includes: Phosphocarrier protein HPr; Fructose-specific phosphotransferase enzyme IIA component] [Xenorhabdus bovienii]